MKKINNSFNELAYEFKTDSGLQVYLVHRPGFKKTTAVYGTPFGALNLKQKVNGELMTHKSGLAHFLEHKLFEDEQGDVLSQFADLGASANAFTSYHQTMYYFDFNGEIEKPLTLLLDFVSEFKITETSVEKEKGIIVEELKMYEQMPDMVLLMETYRNIYHNYPYIYDIAGTEDSVNDTQLFDLEEAYRVNYHDSRMVLSIVTPEDPLKVKKIIDARCKNHIKAMDLVEDLYPEEPMSVNHVNRTIHKKVETPKMSLCYKFPYDEKINKSLDEFLIKLVLEMNFSELAPDYQKALDDEIISNQFSFDIDLREDHGVIYFFNESNHFEEFNNFVDDKMNALEIDEKLFKQLKKRYFGEMVYSLSNVNRLAITLAQSHFEGINYYDYMESIKSLEFVDIFKITDTFKALTKTLLLMTNS